MAQDINRRLKSYQSAKPWREKYWPASFHFAPWRLGVRMVQVARLEVQIVSWQ
jgi:hypothetical protein